LEAGGATTSIPKSGVMPLSQHELDELESTQQKNLSAEGRWNVDSPDCEFLELHRSGTGLKGEADVSGCTVTLNCQNVLDSEMAFRAVFKTERQNYVGIMTVKVLSKNRIHIEYFNGGKGLGAVYLDCEATRMKSR